MTNLVDIVSELNSSNIILPEPSVYGAELGELYTLSEEEGDSKSTLFDDLSISTSGTELTKACSEGNLEKVKFLISSGIDVNEASADSRYPLLLASGENHIEVVRYLLKKGANANNADKFGQTALIYASTSGSEEIVKLLLENKADVNSVDYHNNSALTVASDKGLKDILELLLENGAKLENENISSYTALSLAVKKNNIDIAEILLRNKANPNHIDKNGQTPLIDASAKGNLELVKLLLKYGADVNFVDKDGQTAILFAASKGDIQLVELLLEKLKDIDISDNNGRSILTSASAGGKLGVIKLLLDKGANIEHKDKLSQTPLFYAVKRYEYDAIELLIENGADVNIVDLNKRVPLFYAVVSGNKSLVELLVKNGADVNKVNNEGYSALDMAVTIGNKGLVEYLRSKGAVSARKDYSSYFLGGTVASVIAAGSKFLYDARNEKIYNNHILELSETISSLDFESENKKIIKSVISELSNQESKEGYLYLGKETYPISLDRKTKFEIKDKIIADYLINNVNPNILRNSNEIKLKDLNIKINKSGSLLEVIINNRLVESVDLSSIDKGSLNQEEVNGKKINLSRSYEADLKEMIKDKIDKRLLISKSIEASISDSLEEDLLGFQKRIKECFLGESERSNLRKIYEFYNNEYPRLRSENKLKQVTKEDVESYISRINKQNKELIDLLLPILDSFNNKKDEIFGYIKNEELLSEELRSNLSTEEELEIFKEKIKSEFRVKYLDYNLDPLIKLKGNLLSNINSFNDIFTRINTPEYEREVQNELNKKAKGKKKLNDNASRDIETDLSGVYELIKKVNVNIEKIDDALACISEERKEQWNNRKRGQAKRTEEDKKVNYENSENKKLETTNRICRDLEEISDIDKKLYNIMKISGRLSQYYRDEGKELDSEKLGKLRHYIVHNPYGAINTLTLDMDNLVDCLKRASEGNELSKIDFPEIVENIFNQKERYEKNINNRELEEVIEVIKESKDIEKIKYNILKLCEFGDMLVRAKIGDESYSSLKEIRNKIAHDYKPEKRSDVRREDIDNFVSSLRDNSLSRGRR